MYILNIWGKTRPELVEGHWFRQAQPTPPRFTEKIPINYPKGANYDDATNNYV
jgi:hypothetical protein